MQAFTLIDNVRIQRILGILPVKGKQTLESMGNGSKPSRSQFSCERYKFFLDAPFEIGQQCCREMKKKLSARYTKKTGRVPMTAQLAAESRLRTQQWLKHRCNAFDSKKPISNPMSIWTEQDVLTYIYINKLPICSVYGDVVIENNEEIDGQMNIGDFLGFELFDKRPLLKTTGCDRTGCIFCGFGSHMKGDRRFVMLSETHPKQYDYLMRGGYFDEDGLWKPHKGLGYWFVIEWINLHGNLNIQYANRDYYISKYMTEETEKYLPGLEYNRVEV